MKKKKKALCVTKEQNKKALCYRVARTVSIFQALYIKQICMLTITCDFRFLQLKRLHNTASGTTCHRANLPISLPQESLQHNKPSDPSKS